MFRQVLLGRLPPRLLPLAAAVLLQRKERKETGLYHWRVRWPLEPSGGSPRKLTKQTIGPDSHGRGKGQQQEEAFNLLERVQ